VGRVLENDKWRGREKIFKDVGGAEKLQILRRVEILESRDFIRAPQSKCSGM
jgi:hypothetical protein